MGSALTEEKHLYAALNNCAFVSTENIAVEGPKPFTFLMDASMLGYDHFIIKQTRII
jgi:ribonucleoside-triphosphate reductase (thioredoxin)